MNGRREKLLTLKQETALSLLLQGKSITETSELTGISRTSIHAYMKDPLFISELKRQQEQLLSSNMTLLASSLEKAIRTLVSLLDSDNEMIRRHVSNDIIMNVLKFQELLQEKVDRPEVKFIVNINGNPA